jgi:hypothetical protein
MRKESDMMSAYPLEYHISDGGFPGTSAACDTDNQRGCMIRHKGIILEGNRFRFNSFW